MPIRNLFSLLARLALAVSLLPAARAEIHILSVTSASDFAAGLPGPGSLASVFCSGLNGTQEVHVTVGQNEAPILAVVDLGPYQQINIQVPWETSNVTPVAVSQAGNSATMDSLRSAYGGFFVDANRYAIAQHAADYQLVTEDNPARPGEWIVAYATNLGPVKDPPPTGVAAPLGRLIPLDTGIPALTVPWSFTLWLSQIGGFVSATSNFAGLTPATIGVYSVNFQIPDQPFRGDYQFYFRRLRDCGFFFQQGCGRGVMMDSTQLVKLHGPR
jgi:uncharacterized protein (TIGR03437 family)